MIGTENRPVSRTASVSSRVAIWEPAYRDAEDDDMTTWIVPVTWKAVRNVALHQLDVTGGRGITQSDRLPRDAPDTDVPGSAYVGEHPVPRLEVSERLRVGGSTAC